MDANNNPNRDKANHRTFIYREQTIDTLISAPLVATSKANAMMLIGQARFLVENCFYNEENRYIPVMVNMVLQSGSVNQGYAEENRLSVSKAELTFQVPLICLLPLNSLAVEHVKLDFGLDITSIRRGPTRESHKAEGKILGVLKETTVLNGRIAKDNGQLKRSHGYDNKSHLSFSIEIKAQPLPKGTQTLLDLYTGAIVPVNGKKE